MVEDFCNYDFHDAVIEKIEINSNKTILHIDADGRKVRIICNDTVGVTDICMWEDDIIFDVNLSRVKGVLNPFLQNIRKAHGSDSPICEGLLD